MITFNIPSGVTAPDLVAASEVLRAMAHGLSSNGDVNAFTAHIVDEAAEPFDKFADDKTAIAKATAAMASTDEVKAAATTRVQNGKVASALDLSNLDKDGAPYDPEIHATTKGRTAKDVWKMRKGCNKDLYATRTVSNINLAASMGADVEDEGEDPEDVFTTNLSDDQPWATSEHVGNVYTNAAEQTVADDTPITHEVLMSTAVGHLTSGNITGIEIQTILKDCPGMDGSCAKHLGALSGSVFECVLDDVKEAIALNLTMKGLAW